MGYQISFRGFVDAAVSDSEAPPNLQQSRTLAPQSYMGAISVQGVGIERSTAAPSRGRGFAEWASGIWSRLAGLDGGRGGGGGLSVEQGMSR